jgi:hypothetical protein
LFDKIEDTCDQENGRDIIKGKTTNAPKGVQALTQIGIQAGF